MQFSFEGKDVLIDVIDSATKTTYIDIQKSRKSSEPVPSWLSRQARPDILYKVSRLQSSIKGAKVSTLVDANKVLFFGFFGLRRLRTSR